MVVEFVAHVLNSPQPSTGALAGLNFGDVLALTVQKATK